MSRRWAIAHHAGCGGSLCSSRVSAPTGTRLRVEEDQLPHAFVDQRRELEGAAEQANRAVENKNSRPERRVPDGCFVGRLGPPTQSSS
jgi:hypothetical protein